MNLEPYFTDGRRVIYNGDCLAVLAQLEERSVDAVITDPPYCAGSVSEASRTAAKGQGLRSGNLRRFGWFVGDNMGTAGLSWLLRSVAVESRRILKSSGSLLVFCDWRMFASLEPAIESAGLRFQGLVVWDKGSMGLGLGFRSQHELILHFTNGAPKYHAADVPNVIRAARVGASDRVHQTEKPVALMGKLVRVLVPEGGLAVDPFFGSGSTGVACRENACRCIGIEQDPHLCEVAAARLRQRALFDEAAG